MTGSSSSFGFKSHLTQKPLGLGATTKKDQSARPKTLVIAMKFTSKSKSNSEKGYSDSREYCTLEFCPVHLNWTKRRMARPTRPPCYAPTFLETSNPMEERQFPKFERASIKNDGFQGISLLTSNVLLYLSC